MKVKVTKKSVRENYPKIIAINYCNAQYLLRGLPENMYSTRREGWACDYFEIPRGILVSTGYSPIGKDVDYTLVRMYDMAAGKIWCDYTLDYETRKAKVNNLLADFAGDVERNVFAC